MSCVAPKYSLLGSLILLLILLVTSSKRSLFEDESEKGATQRVFLPLFQHLLEGMGEQVVESPYSMVVHELWTSDEEISLPHLDGSTD